MKDAGKMGKEMVLELFIMLMVVNIRDNGKII